MIDDVNQEFAVFNGDLRFAVECVANKEYACLARLLINLLPLTVGPKITV